MADRPIVFVAGLGRCGTSLTMQMLQAGGLPCAGEWPGFEPDQINPIHGVIDPAWLAAQRGKAVKWLDPFRWAPLPADLPMVTIWLDRNADEQAKSQAKFATMMIGLSAPTRQHMRRWRKGLPMQRDKSVAILTGYPRLSIQFELLIAHPLHAAELRS